MGSSGSWGLSLWNSRELLSLPFIPLIPPISGLFLPLPMRGLFKNWTLELFLNLTVQPSSPSPFPTFSIGLYIIPKLTEVGKKWIHHFSVPGCRDSFSSGHPGPGGIYSPNITLHLTFLFWWVYLWVNHSNLQHLGVWFAPLSISRGSLLLKNTIIYRFPCFPFPFPFHSRCCDWKQVISLLSHKSPRPCHTTRTAYFGEENRLDYYFISQEEFDKMVKAVSTRLLPS